MSTPFDGRITWLHWMGDKVGEQDIRQLVATVRRYSPNATGVAVKSSDGPFWQGTFDSKPLMAVTGPSAIKTWQEELAGRGLDCTLWASVRGKNVSVEASRIIDACHVPGVKAMILDVHAQDWADNGLTAWDVRTLIVKIRTDIPADFHLGLSLDTRGTHPARVYINEWIPHIQSLHPRVFHWEYSEGLRTPDLYVEEAFSVLEQYDRPIVPILQAYPDPTTLTRVPASHITSAAAQAISKGAAGITVSYLGAAGPPEFDSIAKISFPDKPDTSETDNRPRQHYIVITGSLDTHSEPGIDPRTVVGKVSLTQVIEAFDDSRTEQDGFVFMEMVNGEWLTEKKADDSQKFIQKATVVPAGSIPGSEDDRKHFLVVTDTLRVRLAPSLTATEVAEAKLLKGARLEVFPRSRTEQDGFVWWQHDKGWSAEKKIGSTSVYMWEFQPGDDTALPGVPWKFEKLPLSFEDMRWFYYYGNTVFAFEEGKSHNYDGYSQGLHGGLDMGCPGGRNVVAGIHGVFDGPGRSFGPNRVDVLVGDYRIIYGHLAEPATYPVGTPVTPDTYLGKIDSWAAHVHIEIRHKGQLLNPLLFMEQSLRDEILAKYPPVGDRAFYSSTRWDQWLTPMDQPTIVLGGPVIGPRAV